MAASTASIGVDEDPLITIRLENNEEADESWAIRKSKLIKWSGWFRRMFNHDWIETGTNQVKLHDNQRNEVWHLMKCIDAGELVDIEKDGLYEDYDLEYLHEDVIALYRLLDKYDCPDFKRDCRQLIARTVKRCLEASSNNSGWEWSDEMFISVHWYEVVDGGHGNSYPEDLVFIIAEVWCLFEARKKPCPHLDALLKEAPALHLAVSKILRARLNGVAKSMEVKDA